MTARPAANANSTEKQYKSAERAFSSAVLSCRATCEANVSRPIEPAWRGFLSLRDSPGALHADGPLDSFPHSRKTDAPARTNGLCCLFSFSRKFARMGDMTRRTTIVGLGEVLWDVFPDGPRFGGAPANFACSVAELASDSADVFMASAVGSDKLGRRAIESLREHGVDTRGVAVVDRPTGQVLVELDGQGHASYVFAADTAWDNLAWSRELQHLAARA